MPKRSFSLEKGQPKRLEVSWKGFWHKINITLDNQVLGTMENQRELKEGREYTLPDGSKLLVRLSKSLLSPGLEIIKDGTPLPGSDGDPLQKLKVAYSVVFFVGGFNIILGIVAVIGNIGFLLRLGIGHQAVIIGIIFLVLGFFVRKKSIIALGIAIGLLIIDALLGFYLAIQSGGNTPSAGLAIRIIFVIFLFQGFKAIKTIKEGENKT